MDIDQFIDKWGRADRTERQAAQEHFIDLCRVLGEPTPNEAADPTAYSFEKGASKIDGSPGFADVWKRGHFGWEYKKDRANLDRAYQQLQLYSVALEHPPLLVVSDTKRFRIYTNWTNTVQARHEFGLQDLAHSGTRELLKNVFNHPDRLKPDKTREQVTREAAQQKRKAPGLTREEFAKISEVEGLRLSEPMQQAFADFDRRGLSSEERRQAIIGRFKQNAK
jgi:hypothetical protein